MTANPAGNASFTAAFAVDQAPEEVFHAINACALHCGSVPSWFLE